MMNEQLFALEKEAPGGFAIGNDLVYVPDFGRSFNELFKKKVYTPAETAYCDLFSDRVLRYASTWAAKEAVYKAVKQVNATPMGWKSIEIRRAKLSGQPTVNLLKHPGKFAISITITHDGDYVWAVAMLKQL